MNLPAQAIASTDHALGMKDDRRLAERHPARDLCDIRTSGAGFAIPCLVHNLSATGALIETGTETLPERFILRNHTAGTQAVCRAAWRKGRFTGVRFVTEPRTMAPTQGAA